MLNLAVQAWRFLRKLVCLLWKFVLCNRKCLAFVVVDVDVKRPVWCEAFVPWVPLLVTCHSFFTVPFGVVWYKRRNFLYCLPTRLCFEQSMFKCVHKTFCLAIGLWVGGWSTNMRYANWLAEMTERFRWELCSIAWNISLRPYWLNSRLRMVMGVSIFH